MNLPTPPTPRRRDEDPQPRRRNRGPSTSILPLVLLAAAVVGVLVWGLGNDPQGNLEPSRAPSTPASFGTDPSLRAPYEPQPLTQYGADRAAGALLVAYNDPDHFQFVKWDIGRLTGCRVLAWVYDGPTGSTDPRSVPDDIQPDVIGRAHRGGERITVWFSCERGTE